MSEVESATTELKTQYAAQVAADLERNTKEQERIGAEVAALQEQLSALQHDQALLVNLQRTLGAESLEAGSSEEKSVTAAKPSLPRQASAETKSGRRKKATAAKPKKAAAKSAEPKASSPAAKLPTLVELIHNHLGRQSEPRSSAEISTALAEAHPDRDIKPKVVRTTVEGLVAKGHVQRTKQGSSVFYTAAEAPAADNSSEQEPVTA
jgi:hypothetical protein